MDPLRVQSLKTACVQRLEGLILSGEWQIATRLPAERELAAQLNISRPVLHEALIELSAKGLVTIEPRRGVYVSDYRTSGSCALLSSLLNFNGGRLDPAFIRSLIEMRLLVETESSSLAATFRTDEHLRQFNEMIAQESLPDQTIETLTEIDYSFHHLVALASANLVYPLIMNSFKQVYTQLTGQFFRHYYHSPVLSQVVIFHRRFISALELKQPVDASLIMKEMLQHGAALLYQIT